jgi:hypothetical protein
MNISRDEIAKVLSMKPEFQLEESETQGVMEYSWVRRGESKKLEKKMPALLQHNDESASVGSMGRLRLCSDTLEVIAFGSQKFKFAREMIEKYLGACITFQLETENDLRDELRRKLKEKKEQTSVSPMDGGWKEKTKFLPKSGLSYCASSMNSITGNLWILRCRCLKIKHRGRRPKIKCSG